MCAVVKYGGIVTELKGKLGGQVFQKGNASLILRNNAYNKGRVSVFSTISKSDFTSITRLWGSLSAIDQGLWSTAALNWPYYDKFGVQYYGTGYQFFCTLNGLFAGLDLLLQTTPPAPVANEQVLFDGFAISVSGDYTVQMDTDYTQDGWMVVYASTPSRGTKNFGAYKLKKIDQFGVTGHSTFSFKTQYQNKFTAPVAGNYVAVRAIYRNAYYPQLTVISESVVEVVA